MAWDLEMTMKTMTSINEDDTAVNESDEESDYLIRPCLFANNLLIFSML